MKTPLQWGRGLSPTETSSAVPEPPAQHPLQWGRGLSPTETRSKTNEKIERKKCFNGAAGFRPRRPRQRTCAAREAGQLQWGRGLSPTETSLAAPVPRAPCPASMGPRAFAHGDWERSGDRGDAGGASMGPRAFAHGDKPKPEASILPPASFNGAAGFRPRRRRQGFVRQRVIFSLQWGRGLSPTETWRR